MDWNRRALLAGGVGVLARADAAKVLIDDYAFVPAELHVPAGTSVTWENHDSSPHNVQSALTPQAFRSRTMAPGESFEFTFAMPGTYRYFCGLHPHMQGAVIVG